MCKFTGRHFTCVQAYWWGKSLEVILTPDTLMGNWDLSNWWFLVKWDKGKRIKNTHPIVNTWWRSGPFWRTSNSAERVSNANCFHWAFWPWPLFFQIWLIFLNWITLVSIVNFSFLLIVFALYHHLLYCSWPPVHHFTSGSSSANNPEQRAFHYLVFLTSQKPILNTFCSLTTFSASHWFICWVQLTLPPKSLPKLPHPFQSSLAWIILNSLLTASRLLSLPPSP